MNTVLIAALCTLGVGLFVGVFLGVAGIVFKVKTDEREEKVLAAHPVIIAEAADFPDVRDLLPPLSRARLR